MSRGLTRVQALMLSDEINGSDNVKTYVMRSTHHHVWQLKMMHMNDLILHASSRDECLEILAMWSDEASDLEEVA